MADHIIGDVDLTRSTADAWAHALRLLTENEALKDENAELRSQLAATFTCLGCAHVRTALEPRCGC